MAEEHDDEAKKVEITKARLQAIVYKGELGRCTVGGVGGEFVQGKPVLLVGEGSGPKSGEPIMTLEQAEQLVAEHRSITWDFVTDKNGEIMRDAKGNAKTKMVAHEVFSLVEI